MVRRLLVLNGLAAICAVGHHAVVWVLTATVWWVHGSGAVGRPEYGEIYTFSFYVIRLLDQVASAAVPAFLCVSGYFMFMLTRGPAGARASSVWRRVWRLLPPYVLWSLVLVALDGVKGTGRGPGEIVQILLTGGAAPPFYYVPLLVQLCLLAIVFGPVAGSRHWKVLLGLAAATQLGVAALRTLVILGQRPLSGLLPAGLVNWPLPSYAFWFVLGLVIAARITDFRAFLVRLRPAFPFILLATAAASFLEWEITRAASQRPWIAAGNTVTDNVFALALLLSYFTFDVVKTPNGKIAVVGSMSYGIYLIHVPVLEAVARTAYHLTPVLLAHPLAFLSVLAAAGVVLPVLLMKASAASPLRPYYGYAFG